jgi:hypothetical protein
LYCAPNTVVNRTMGQNQINDDHHNKNALSIWKMPRHLVYNIKTSSVLN